MVRNGGDGYCDQKPRDKMGNENKLKGGESVPHALCVRVEASETGKGEICSIFPNTVGT